MSSGLLLRRHRQWQLEKPGGDGSTEAQHGTLVDSRCLYRHGQRGAQRGRGTHLLAAFRLCCCLWAVHAVLATQRSGGTRGARWPRLVLVCTTRGRQTLACSLLHAWSCATDVLVDSCTAINVVMSMLRVRVCASVGPWVVSTMCVLNGLAQTAWKERRQFTACNSCYLPSACATFPLPHVQVGHTSWCSLLAGRCYPFTGISCKHISQNRARHRGPQAAHNLRGILDWLAKVPKRP